MKTFVSANLVLDALARWHRVREQPGVQNCQPAAAPLETGELYPAARRDGDGLAGNAEDPLPAKWWPPRSRALLLDLVGGVSPLVTESLRDADQPAAYRRRRHRSRGGWRRKRLKNLDARSAVNLAGGPGEVNVDAVRGELRVWSAIHAKTRSAAGPSLACSKTARTISSAVNSPSSWTLPVVATAFRSNSPALTESMPARSVSRALSLCPCGA